MDYYLTLDRQQYRKGIDNYYIIDVSEYNSLSDIIDFTTTFECEEHLKNFLVNKGLADENIIRKPLKIIKVNKNDEYKSLPYRVPYASDKQYYVSQGIINYLLDNTNDKNLLIEFYQNFKNAGPQNSHFGEVLRSFNYFINAEYYDPYDNVGVNELISDLINTILKYQKEKLPTIHKMAMIIINNEDKKIKKNKKQELEDAKLRLQHIRQLLNEGQLLPDEIERFEKEEFELMNVVGEIGGGTR